MMNLLEFLRTENSKPSGPSISQIQRYTKTEFDLVLGTYEAKCLARYVGLCGEGQGGNDCLLLPYAEDMTQKKWCRNLDHMALKELYKMQHKKKNIRKRDLRDYRSQVRKQRVSRTCNIRVLQIPKAPEPSTPLLGTNTHVYDFATTVDVDPAEESANVLLKTQSVIDSIKKLNYLSDSTSEFSNCSRHSSFSNLEDDDLSLCDMHGHNIGYGGADGMQRTTTTVTTYASVDANCPSDKVNADA